MSEQASIHTGSHAEALEWSLVLVSQGIESTIEPVEEGEGWRLALSSSDYERAMVTLQQYRLENRGWPWQQRLPASGYLFDWGSLAWVLLLGFFFWMDTRLGLRQAGLMDASLVSHGQWWRLFTAIWLHADVSHLATNATLGALLLGLTMGRFGTGVCLLSAYLAGAAGNLAPWLLGLGMHRSLGASGMVMGALGLLAGQSLGPGRSVPPPLRLAGFLAGLMLLVLFGLNPQTDVLAHVGGFIAGGVLGWVWTRVPAAASRAGTDLAAGLGLTVLTLLPWWLALRGAGH